MVTAEATIVEGFITVVVAEHRRMVERGEEVGVLIAHRRKSL
jgi:hypothetical protein